MKYTKYTLVSVIGLFLIIMIFSYLNIMRYPINTRLSYFKKPNYVIESCYGSFLQSRRFNKDKALEKVKLLRFEPIGEAKFLYLVNNGSDTINESPFKSYFSNISKIIPPSKEEAFWEIKVSTGIVFVEVESGRIIYYKADALNDYGNPEFFE